MLDSPPPALVPEPPDEVQRRDAVLRSGLLDASPDAGLDGLVRLAAHFCETKSAEINVVGAELRFVAARGLGTPGELVDRRLSFCAWTILDPDRPLLVPDALEDDRFSGNPFVLDGTIRSYAGFPLVSDGQAIGTMCVHDPAPGGLNRDKLEALRALATAAQAQVALRRHADALSALARTDALTGAANRRAIDEALERELERARRTGAPLVVLLLDMDRFKHYNDRFGHLRGDVLLQRAAAAWRAALRTTDVLGRWGGEEFCVLLADCSPAGAEQLAERLRAAVPEGQTCSIGVACWDRQEDVPTLVRRADEALYAAKRDGRDRVVSAA